MMMKSNSGITLVALVITIIVLLILAGVSISLVVGDNGIMTRAKDAGTKTEEADAVETFKLAVASLTSDYFSKQYTEATKPTETSVSLYVAAQIKTELENMDYKLVDASMDGALPTGDAESVTKTVKIQKNGGKEIQISYDVTKSGNISNIKK